MSKFVDEQISNEARSERTHERSNWSPRQEKKGKKSLSVPHCVWSLDVAKWE